ncbi:hypothetical protein [Edaphobacter bradus]|uniref:hypothetical protein n=1 Tax=Edaphobacter bradus TaxID=2259016 RepID=UPI0021E062FA|nr:hypothetical protein [Edaphobacter bradus]
MSAALAILPVIWATFDEQQHPAAPAAAEVESGLAFYRKYTEALLRRYVKLAMEAGRAPSLLGRELFRGNVTHYRVQWFDDVVIFVHDVERCLATLDQEQQTLIDRIALQEYTHGEAAELMRLPIRTLIRRYERTLDNLTQMFLERKLLEPLKSCQ